MAPEKLLTWSDLTPEAHELLKGKLSGLWGAETDAVAFESWSIDKQHALLLLVRRMRDKNLWRFVKRVINIYGEGGVGMQFDAWPMILSTLENRPDFTRRFAKHKDTSGGFYEKGRHMAVLHFLYKNGEPRVWYVHFDLYSPVHTLQSALKHLRHESSGKLTPDWRMIADILNS
jgi:hypothetical protein